MQEGESDGICIKLTYDGLLAARGQVPLYDLVTSLGGWRGFLDLSTSAFVQKSLTVHALPPEQAVQITLSSPERGSLGFLLQVFGGYLGSKIAQNDTFWVKALLRWWQCSYDNHLREKRSLHSLDEVVASLGRLASEHGIRADSEDAAEAMLKMDADLKQATFPVDKSVGRITLTGPDTNIDVGSVERRHLHSGFHIHKRDEELIEALVVFKELNTSTAHAQVEVLESSNALFRGRPSAYVERAIAGQPRNAYARSLYEQVPLCVWVRPVFNKTKGTVDRWNMMSSPPEPDGPLLG